MKRLAGLILSILLIAGGLLMAPRMASRAYASGPISGVGPTPSVPPVTIPPLQSPSPTPIPSPSPSTPGGGGGGGGGGNDGGGGGNDGGGGGTSGPTASPSPSPSKTGKSPNEGGDNTTGKNKNKNLGGKHQKGKGGKKGTAGYPQYKPSGTFSTAKLVTVATRLLALGYTQQEVEKQVYRPFILAGNAAWSNTWGAPRFGPAPGEVRTHEGQDVFCNYGDPVLATISGMVEYDSGGLGGTIARLYSAPNNYWYYAHLSGINDKEHPNHSQVKPGDVIGYCGNSGDASSTAPHVHFGWYVNHVAQNPMKPLIGWLHAAELRVLGVVSKATDKKVAAIDRLTLERRFGDSFAPDLSEMKVSGESLWASGSSPATGAFALAQAALQAALSGGTTGPATTDPGAAAEADAGSAGTAFAPDLGGLLSTGTTSAAGGSASPGGSRGDVEIGD